VGVSTRVEQMFDPLGLRPKTAEAFVAMQEKEINNGRLAMIGIAGTAPRLTPHRMRLSTVGPVASASFSDWGVCPLCGAGMVAQELVTGTAL
jgi:hypothetical protein